MNGALKNYFNALASVIDKQAQVAGFSSENADIGKSREYICKSLFDEHIPNRLSTHAGGDVFNDRGIRSGQIDIIITHDMSLNFSHNHIVSCAVESVSAAVGIKSMLNKQEIESSLKNIASIPQLNPSIIQTGQLTRASEEYINEWPAFFIFAYNGISATTSYEYVCSFLENNDVPMNRIPRAIIVNRQYVMVFTNYDKTNKSTAGNFIRSDLKLHVLSNDKKGMPLFWMMIELAKSTSWLDGMYLDYRSYYENAFM